MLGRGVGIANCKMKIAKWVGGGAPPFFKLNFCKSLNPILHSHLPKGSTVALLLHTGRGK